MKKFFFKYTHFVQILRRIIANYCLHQDKPVCCVSRAALNGLNWLGIRRITALTLDSHGPCTFMQYLMQAGAGKWLLVCGSRSGSAGTEREVGTRQRPGNRILLSFLSSSRRDTFTVLTQSGKLHPKVLLDELIKLVVLVIAVREDAWKLEKQMILICGGEVTQEMRLQRKKKKLCWVDGQIMELRIGRKRRSSSLPCCFSSLLDTWGPFDLWHLLCFCATRPELLICLLVQPMAFVCCGFRIHHRMPKPKLHLPLINTHTQRNANT